MKIFLTAMVLAMIDASAALACGGTRGLIEEANSEQQTLLRSLADKKLDCFIGTKNVKNVEFQIYSLKRCPGSPVAANLVIKGTSSHVVTIREDADRSLVMKIEGERSLVKCYRADR